VNESPVDAARTYTKGLDFPASKQQVLDAFERNRAPQDVVEIIRSKSWPRFVSSSDIQMLLREETSPARGTPAERGWGHWRPPR